MNRNNNNNILVPTDFSEIANNALGHALAIADVYKNEITLLNIQDEGGFLGLFGNDEKMGLIKEAVEMKMDKLIAESAKNYPNVKINKRVEYGRIFKVITEIAEKENLTVSLWEPTVPAGFSKSQAAMPAVSSITPRCL